MRIEKVFIAIYYSVGGRQLLDDEWNYCAGERVSRAKINKPRQKKIVS